MKNNMILFGMAGLMAATLLSCEKKVEVTTTASSVEVNKDSIKTVIQEMENAYAKAMEEKSIDGIMVYYADDVTSIDGGKEPVTGKENVKKAISEMLANLPAKSKIAMEPTDIKVSNDGEMVFETGKFTMKDSTGTEAVKGYFSTLFEKKDGKYECVQEMVTTTTKKEAAKEAKK